MVKFFLTKQELDEYAWQFYQTKKKKKNEEGKGGISVIGDKNNEHQQWKILSLKKKGFILK